MSVVICDGEVPTFVYALEALSMTAIKVAVAVAMRAQQQVSSRVAQHGILGLASLDDHVQPTEQRVGHCRLQLSFATRFVASVDYGQ